MTNKICSRCGGLLRLERKEILPLLWCVGCGLKLPPVEYPDCTLIPVAKDNSYWKLLPSGQLVREVLNGKLAT